MSPLLVAAICALALATAGVAGIRLRPGEAYRVDVSRDAILFILGVVSAVTSLVLGLLIASAEENFSNQGRRLQELAAEVTVLDRVLEQYGPEAQPARAALRTVVDRFTTELWPERSPKSAMPSGPMLVDAVTRLAPTTPREIFLQQRALDQTTAIARARAAMGVIEAESNPWALTTGLIVSWLMLLFFAAGLFIHWNGAAIGIVIGAGAIVASALFLLMEFAGPFDGFVRLSDRGLLGAVALRSPS